MITFVAGVPGLRVIYQENQDNENNVAPSGHARGLVASVCRFARLSADHAADTDRSSHATYLENTKQEDFHRKQETVLQGPDYLYSSSGHMSLCIVLFILFFDDAFDEFDHVAMKALRTNN